MNSNVGYQKNHFLTAFSNGKSVYPDMDFGALAAELQKNNLLTPEAAQALGVEAPTPVPPPASR